MRTFLSFHFQDLHQPVVRCLQNIPDFPRRLGSLSLSTDCFSLLLWDHRHLRLHLDATFLPGLHAVKEGFSRPGTFHAPCEGDRLLADVRISYALVRKREDIFPSDTFIPSAMAELVLSEALRRTPTPDDQRPISTRRIPFINGPSSFKQDRPPARPYVFQLLPWRGRRSVSGTPASTALCASRLLPH